MVVETQNIPLALDARMLGAHGTGVATYAGALHDALNARTTNALHLTDNIGGRAAPAPRIERWFRWCDAMFDRPRRLTRSGDALHARDVFRLAQVHFDRHHALLRLRAPGRPGIMHWTYPLPVRIEGWINVYTVHDAIPLTDPSLTPIDGQRHARLLQAILADNGHILTVSQAAKQDIVAAVQCAPDRVSICPTGLAVSHPCSSDLPAGLVPRRFFLAIGTVEPRKNLARLIAAYRSSGTQLPLVIAGPSGWRAEEIEPLLAACPGVVRLAYPPRDTLMSLVAEARALLFPSLAEGFGLPIVEAMMLGTAVMTSRRGATEEIAGGAALLIDPLDTDDMSSAIAALSSDDALVARMVAAGHVRSADFTLEHFARQIGNIHHALLVEYGWRSTVPCLQHQTDMNEMQDE